jgi:hypothetical protein
MENVIMNESCDNLKPVEMLSACDHDYDHEEEVIKDIKHELEAIKADTLYHEFLIDVSLNPTKPTDDPTDTEFHLEEELAKQGLEDLQDADDSDSSSSSDDEDVKVDHEEAEEDEGLTRVDVKVPPKALKEAAARFPAFWRVKQQLRSTDADYKSDEDPDYDPNDDIAHEVIDLVSSSSSDESDAEIHEEETDDMTDLIEMIEDLGIPSNNQEDDVNVEDEEKVEQVCLVQSIVEFDDDSYRSDEDPDFVPPEVEDVSAGDSSSEDDSTDTEVMQE